MQLNNVVLCVNKMDLIGWSQARFDEICGEFRRFAAKLEVHDVTFVPVSALHGDNIVHRSASMPWYEGMPLLHHLEEVHIASDRNLIDARFPVQYVIRRQDKDFRGYAGTVASGALAVGDDLVVLPSGLRTKVAALWGPGGAELAEAAASSSVTVELADHLDAGRGDLFCRPGNRPLAGADVDAMVCWFAERSDLRPGATYAMRHTTQQTTAEIRALEYRLDVNTLHRDESATSLSLNEIGRVHLRTRRPLLFDPYRRNRATGSFILIDAATNNTVAAGMIIGPNLPGSRVVWHGSAVSREQRRSSGATVWLTGLSGSGKSSVAVELERLLVSSGRPAYVLDGDNLRHGLNADLGFGEADRAENVRRVGEVAQLLADAGIVAIVSLISPYRADRARVRAAHDASGLPFVEVFVDTPLQVCESRDPKGMYARARAGEIHGFTGVDQAYQRPAAPELILRPDDGDPAAMAAAILGRLNQ